MQTCADKVLIGGNILTMNPNQPNAEGIAIRGKRIIGVGTSQEIKRLIGEKTEIINLEGKTVLPGFIDTHIHVTDYGRLLSWLNLENAHSIKEIQYLIQQYIKRAKKDSWILGKGLKIVKNQSLSKKDLDIVSPENPIVIYYQSGQTCFVNSKALEAARIAEQNDNGIERDVKTGEPTGILQDNATNLVWNIIPQPTCDELYDYTKLALQSILEAGITRIHWIVLSEAELSVIRKIAEKDELNLNVFLIVPADLLDSSLNTLIENRNEHLQIGGAIIFADGYLASRTAALNQPYSDKPEEKGKMLVPEKEILKTAEKIQATGLQLIIHAVGDKAVQTALNVIEATKSYRQFTPRIEQAGVLNQKLVQQIKKQKIMVTIQPSVVASEFSTWSAADHLGKDRIKWLFPVKMLIESGVLVAAGSDCPMEPLDPLIGIKAAIERRSQQIDFLTAVQMYTLDGAVASFKEKDEGSIENGKLANLVILNKTVDMEKAENNSVLQTIFEGNTVRSKK